MADAVLQEMQAEVKQAKAQAKRAAEAAKQAAKQAAKAKQAEEAAKQAEQASKQAEEAAERKLLSYLRDIENRLKCGRRVQTHDALLPKHVNPTVKLSQESSLSQLEVWQFLDLAKYINLRRIQSLSTFKPDQITSWLQSQPFGAKEDDAAERAEFFTKYHSKITDQRRAQEFWKSKRFCPHLSFTANLAARVYFAFVPKFLRASVCFLAK